MREPRRDGWARGKPMEHMRWSGEFASVRWDRWEVALVDPLWRLGLGTTERETHLDLVCVCRGQRARRAMRRASHGASVHGAVALVFRSSTEHKRKSAR
jgi:hypothetical protein